VVSFNGELNLKTLVVIICNDDFTKKQNIKTKKNTQFEYFFKV